MYDTDRHNQQTVLQLLPSEIINQRYLPHGLREMGGDTKLDKRDHEDCIHNVHKAVNAFLPLRITHNFMEDIIFSMEIHNAIF